MGNEMGNRNVSGMQEPDNTEVEGSKESMETSVGLVNADSVQGEKQQLSSPKKEDFQEKHTGLASESPSRIDGPDIEKQTSDGREQDKTEIQAPEESSKSSTTSNNEYCISSGMQSVLSSEDGKFHEHTSSPSQENLSITNDHQIQRQTSIGIDEEETRSSYLDSNPTVPNPESMELENLESRQQEPAIAHTEPSVEYNCKLQESNEIILELSGPHNFEEKGHELEDMVFGLNGSVVPDTNSEIEKNGEDKQMNDSEYQDENVANMSNSDEKKFEVIDGDKVLNNLSEETPKTSLSEVENEEGKEHPPTELNLHGNDAMDSRDLHPETVPLTKSLKSTQLETSEPEDKYVVLTNDTKMIENESEIEQDQHNFNPTSLSECSVEESKTKEMNTSQSEFMMIGTVHEENRKGSEFDNTSKSEIERDFPIDDAKVNVNYQVDLQDGNLSMISEDHGNKELDGETEMVAVVDTVSTEFTLTDSNHEGEELPTCSLSSLDPTENKVVIEMMEKTEEADFIGNDTEGRGTMKLNLSQFNPTEPMEFLLPPHPVSPVYSQDPKQDRLMGTETVDIGSVSTVGSNQESCDVAVINKASKFEATNSSVETLVSRIESENEKSEQHHSQYPEMTTMTLEPSDICMDCSQGQEPTCDQREITCDHDPKSDFEAPENSENSTSELIQENINTKIDEVRAQSCFDFYSPTGESEVPTTQSHKQFSEEAEVPAFASCDSEVQESTDRFTNEPVPENINVHIEVSKPPNFDFELPLEARMEESDRTPLLYQEKTAKGNVFELKSSASETLANRVNGSVKNPVAETGSSALNATKEESGQDPSQHEKVSVEKHVAALERTDSEKLKTPLLNNLKGGESYAEESPQKKESLVAKKVVEDVWNTPTNKASATSLRGREKRKPKYSLFSNCMCCTAWIQ